MGSTVGISLCVLFSSLIADYNLALALLASPAVLCVFGAVYYMGPLSIGARVGNGADAPQPRGV